MIEQFVQNFGIRLSFLLFPPANFSSSRLSIKFFTSGGSSPKSGDQLGKAESSLDCAQADMSKSGLTPPE